MDSWLSERLSHLHIHSSCHRVPGAPGPGAGFFSKHVSVASDARAVLYDKAYPLLSKEFRLLQVQSLFQVISDCRNLSIVAGGIWEKEQTRRRHLLPHENAWPGSCCQMYHISSLSVICLQCLRLFYDCLKIWEVDDEFPRAGEKVGGKHSKSELGE